MSCVDGVSLQTKRGGILVAGVDFETDIPKIILRGFSRDVRLV